MALTPEQEAALALLREGRSAAEVAEALGIARPTVWQWQNELPEFVDTLRERRDSSAPWTWRETVRVAVPIVLVLLTAVLFWLAYR